MIRLLIVTVNVLTVLVILSFLGVLGGCATPMGDIRPAPKWCTTFSKGLPQLKEGDDLVERHAALMRLNKEDSSKLRCLRRYAKAVSKS